MTPSSPPFNMQSVYELHDGSALFVTVAKYVTPSGATIDKRGITPDISCVTSFPGLLAPTWMAGDTEDTVGPVQQALPQPDATGFSPGLPLSPAMERALVKQLGHDRCVAAAEVCKSSQRGRCACGRQQEWRCTVKRPLVDWLYV